MAGQDQSQNLGGMLNQIADTVGSRASAFTPLINAASKPRGDMNDPAHLQRLAQWASSTGDAQAASMYSQDARRIHAERKQVTDATTINTATSAYKAAREGGDPTAILEAEKALIDAANATGQDANARLDGVQRSLSQAEESAYLKQQRELAEKDRQAMEQFTQELNSVTTEADIQDVVNNADPSVAAVAQRAATGRLQYLEAKTVRAERDSLAVQDIAMDSIVLDTTLPPSVQAAHKAELESINKAIAAGQVGGTWEPGVRAELIKRREKLAEKIYHATYGQEMAKVQTTNQRRRDRDGKASRVAITPPTKSVAEDIKKELEQKNKSAKAEAAKDNNEWFPNWQDSDEITVEMINAEYRRQQMAALDAEYSDLDPRVKKDESVDESAEEGTEGNPIVIP